MSSRSSKPKREGKGERVQKVLANTGLASRREIDRLVKAGRILIDGRPAVPGDRIHGDEKVLVDGQRVRLNASTSDSAGSVLLYHKPVGEVTSRRDTEGRPTVFDKLPEPRSGRWIAIGRLDIATSGLLLFTTDGELAHRLMHPSFEVQREYAARIRGKLSEPQLQSLTKGIMLDDGMARFNRLEPMESKGTNSWYRVELSEGRNREVRRLFEAAGSQVSRLIRTQYGPISLGRVSRSQYRFLDQSATAALYRSVKLKPHANAR